MKNTLIDVVVMTETLEYRVGAELQYAQEREEAVKRAEDDVKCASR